MTFKVRQISFKDKYCHQNINYDEYYSPLTFSPSMFLHGDNSTNTFHPVESVSPKRFSPHQFLAL